MYRHMLSATVLFTVVSIVLPSSAGPAPIAMDYAAYDVVHHRVWVPAGGTGKVDVIDTQTNKLTAVDGFPTRPSKRPGRPAMGPSSVTLGGDSAWIGNRADETLCQLDASTLARRGCMKLPSIPDGVAYVGATHEVWITTPEHESITIVDVASRPPTVQTELKLPGSPEGYAVDEQRGIFYTNLEDKDQTLAIDIKSRKVVSTWSAGCGKEGPRGLEIDVARRLLLVACTDGVRSRDLAHDGRLGGRLATGKGVDNLAYGSESLYVASGEDGMLTVVHVAAGGALTKSSSTPTSKGARNAVVDDHGTAYVPDGQLGRILVLPARP